MSHLNTLCDQSSPGTSRKPTATRNKPLRHPPRLPLLITMPLINRCSMPYRSMKSWPTSLTFLQLDRLGHTVQLSSAGCTGLEAASPRKTRSRPGRSCPSSDAEKSTAAQLNATGLPQRVHAARAESWKGAALSLILRRQEQARLCGQLQPPSEQAPGRAKMTCLQSAARAAEELRSARATGSQLALANGAAPTRKDYEALLKSAAPTCDRARAPAKRQLTRPAERAGTCGASVTDSFHRGCNGSWSFKRALGHEGPFAPSDPEREGSKRSALLWRGSGEATPEPLSVFGGGDPMTRAARACKRGLLDEEGRRRLKGAAKREAP